MIKVALVVFFLQLILQTGSVEADFCNNMKSDVKKQIFAFKVLCPKGKDDKHLGPRCCQVIEQDLTWHRDAYRRLCLNNAILKSCAELYKYGVRRNGVYIINPDGLGSFQVRCDMTTDGGGWTVFQRRQDGSEDFYRGWSDYKAGFGDLDGEFWLGLDYINRLTKSGQNVLRVDLMDFNNAARYAQYGSFTVADETDKYRLNVGKYSDSADAGDSLSYHNGRMFSTKDNDNDKSRGGNCALNWKAGWWYNSCARSNLNGLYGGPGATHYTGNHWRDWKMDSLKKVEMKVRPSQFEEAMNSI